MLIVLLFNKFIFICLQYLLLNFFKNNKVKKSRFSFIKIATLLFEKVNKLLGLKEETLFKKENHDKDTYLLSFNS